MPDEAYLHHQLHNACGEGKGEVGVRYEEERVLTSKIKSCNIMTSHATQQNGG